MILNCHVNAFLPRVTQKSSMCHVNSSYNVSKTVSLAVIMSAVWSYLKLNEKKNTIQPSAMYASKLYEGSQEHLKLQHNKPEYTTKQC